ncbi:MAG: serine protease [Thermobacillus sp.]|uniref:NfeD family protein n=1 Tax=Thermobacillus sp. TaxID=2108467 RepID=UPI000E3739A3|nr:nodulation protein NfeD [Thermobacillus sp.]REK59649.1 MAG: serine protease [Thermobacillus sp.]
MRPLNVRSRLRAAAAALMLLAALAAIVPAAQAADAGAGGAGPAVYVIPVRQTIESGLEAFLKRAFREAEEVRAERIVLVINTNGGRLENAQNIGDLVGASPVPVTAFVESKAFSAGAYIALNADQIVMRPGSSIGAAAMVDAAGNLVDNPKQISAWTAEMRDAAEASGRDPNIAAAMADPNYRGELPGIGRDPGGILTLTAEEALRVGYADHLADSVEEVIAWLGLEQRAVVHVEPSLAERAARVLTQPGVMLLLLIIGIAGIVIEMLVPGFGVPGVVGLLALVLYFFGQYVAGFAGMESVALFVAGIILLVLELFVPSYGILGILGGAAIIGGIATAAYDAGDAVTTLLYALGAAAVLAAVAGYIFRRRGVWNKFILRESLTSEEGYLSTEARTDLAGKSGTALTPLRPAGVVLIDGERIDAVSEGGFVEPGARVRVVRAEGLRVVVKESKDE